MSTDKQKLLFFLSNVKLKTQASHFGFLQSVFTYQKLESKKYFQKSKRFLFMYWFNQPKECENILPVIFIWITCIFDIGFGSLLFNIYLDASHYQSCFCKTILSLIILDLSLETFVRRITVSVNEARSCSKVTPYSIAYNEIYTCVLQNMVK